jgi:hypothetical protein
MVVTVYEIDGSENLLFLLMGAECFEHLRPWVERIRHFAFLALYLQGREETNLD